MRSLQLSSTLKRVYICVLHMLLPAGEAELSRLDSSIKKNGAFIKKLRQLSADNRQQLLAEAAKLNLSKVAWACYQLLGHRDGFAMSWAWGLKGDCKHAHEQVEDTAAQHVRPIQATSDVQTSHSCGLMCKQQQQDVWP